MRLPLLPGPAPLPTGDYHRSLGRMLAGGPKRTAGQLAQSATRSGKDTPKRGERRADDFYPTPADVTWALLVRESTALWTALSRQLGGAPSVWEPCCGDGAISAVLRARGFAVVESDICPLPPVTGAQTANVLELASPPACVAVTNPPFALALPIAEHLLERLGVSYLALLLKATWWHAAERQALWRKRPPAAVYPLTWRPDFLAQGAPTMDVIWVVWDAARAGQPCAYEPLPRPMVGQEALL